jgi:hypothetical protein
MQSGWHPEKGGQRLTSSEVARHSAIECTAIRCASQISANRRRAERHAMNAAYNNGAGAITDTSSGIDGDKNVICQRRRICTKINSNVSA